MSKLTEDLLNESAWSGLIMGNHALVRSMLESGVRVITTYPGSPTPEIAAALDAIPGDRRRFYFEYSTNEKVALELAAGASLNGHLSAVFFKSVGLNVALDSLIQLSLMELIGGMVVVLGDDPGANSSQNEQDNRHIARMAYLSMLEPATPTEAYAMFGEACRLAQKYRTAVFLRLTTHVCHAREVVAFGPLSAPPPDWTPRFDPANGPYIPVAHTVHPLKRKALQKLASLQEEAEQSPFLRVISPNGAPSPKSRRCGVIAAGLPALYALENLAQSTAQLDVLKLCCTHPLPAKAIASFLRAHDEMLVLEELDRVLETELKALAYDQGLSCRLHVRGALEELQGEQDPRRSRLLLTRHWPELFPPLAQPEPALGVTPRLPQMCPGCGHRAAFHAIKQALPKAAITVADIGCHTLGNQPPYAMGQVLFCMGASPALAAGLAVGNRTRKVVAFLGDSTLFHAGLPGIVNAIVRDHPYTLVLMENGTTAMTGHQPRTGSGEVGQEIPLGRLFESLGVQWIREVDTFQQAELGRLLQEALAQPHFSVLIARHPCMLKFGRARQKKSPGLKVAQVEVDSAVCDQRHVCVSEFGCPSFVLRAGGQVSTHKDLCIGDGSCLQTCPVKALQMQRPQSKPAGGEP